MIYSKGFTDLLLTFKTMRQGQFALFRKSKQPGRYVYYQVNMTSSVPDGLFDLPKEGVLLGEDLNHNLEIVSKIAKLLQEDIMYVYPSPLGFWVKAYSIRGELLLEDEIKLVSATGFSTWIQLKFIKFKLWMSKNKLYKMF